MSSNFKVIRNVELKVCVQTCEAGLKVCMQTCETRLKVWMQTCEGRLKVPVVPFGLLQVTSLQSTRSMCTLDPKIARASGTHATNLRIEDIEVGRETCQFSCHEQAVRFRRLRVISLQRTRSMCTLEPRIAGASGTHAMKLRIEVRRQTCRLSCTC